MPDTILKALLTLQIQSRTSTLDLPNSSSYVFRIVATETVSTATATPPELRSTQQDLSYDTLLILLHAAIVREQPIPSSAKNVRQTRLNAHKTEQGTDCRDLEAQLRELSVNGSHQLHTNFTWIVAQKATFLIDQDK